MLLCTADKMIMTNKTHKHTHTQHTLCELNDRPLRLPLWTNNSSSSQRLISRSTRWACC